MILPAFATAAMLVATLGPAMAASQGDTELPRGTGDDVSNNEQIDQLPVGLNARRWHNWKEFRSLPVAGYITDSNGNYLAARSTDAQDPYTRLLTFSPIESEAVLFLLTPTMYSYQPKEGFSLTVAYNGESPNETKGWTVSFPRNEDGSTDRMLGYIPPIITDNSYRAAFFEADTDTYFRYGDTFLVVVGSQNNADYPKTGLQLSHDGPRADGSIMPYFMFQEDINDDYVDYQIKFYEVMTFVPVGEGPVGKGHSVNV